MYKYFPLLVVGGVIGALSIAFVAVYAAIIGKKRAFSDGDRTMKDGEILRRLGKYARPYARSFVFVAVCLLFSVSYDIASPLLVGYIEGIIKEQFELARLFALVAVYAGILVVSLVSTYMQAIVLQRTGQKIISALRVDLFSHIEGLSHAQLNSIPVGKLVTRVTNDTNAISLMFTSILATLTKNLVVIFCVLAAMLALNYMLTLAVLCFVPFILLFTYVFRSLARRAYRRVKDDTTEINTFLSENLSGIKVTQIFNGEAAKMEQFSVRNSRLGAAKSRQIFVFAVFQPLVHVLYYSSVLVLLYLGGLGYIDGISFLGQTISAEIVVTFYMYTSKFFTPIQNLAEQFNQLQSAFASAEKIFTVLDIAPDVVDEEGAEELEQVRGDIEFKDVWFAYTPGEWVLKGVSFRVSARQTVAFVGATGSGKTTILSLLCRNYDIQKGSILVDGKDIRHIKISSLRRHFGQMLQDVFLFSGTVRGNIALRGDFTDEEIRKACEYVNASSFISRLEHGLDEEVRERGNNFSAGQRQLLSFARTVIHRPEVMILDEATANIDTETELLIQDSLSKMKNIGTMLIVAHRLSTIRNADNIIVLSHGEIVEQGTHAQLLARRGRYYRLYTLQSHRESLGKA